MRALDFFAADGSMLSHRLLKDMDVVAWDIRPCVMNHFAGVKIRGDSFKLAEEARFQRGFDYILIDNTAGPFGELNEYCEHFEALPAALPLLRDEGTISFNVVESCSFYTLDWLKRSWRILPQNLWLTLTRVKDGYVAEWLGRRDAYYGSRSACSRGFAEGFYAKLFGEFSFEVTGVKVKPRIWGLNLYTFSLHRVTARHP